MIMEGTTGANGLLGMGGKTPQQFSMLTVGADCQFQSITRYSLPDPLNRKGGNSSVTQYTFEPREMVVERTCDPLLGLEDEPTSWTVPQTGQHVLAEQK